MPKRGGALKEKEKETGPVLTQYLSDRRGKILTPKREKRLMRNKIQKIVEVLAQFPVGERKTRSKKKSKSMGGGEGASFSSCGNLERVAGYAKAIFI